MIFQSIQQLTLRLLRNFGKPLFNLLKCKKNNPFRSRKTLPCIKGIETKLAVCSPPITPVERPCPVSKGLKPIRAVNSFKRAGVERPCPVSKGLKPQLGLLQRVPPSRKTLPCIKGIETCTKTTDLTDQLGRKTLPCIKGIETIQSC